MSDKNLSSRAMNFGLEKIIQEVLSILDTEDGKSSAEKLHEAISYLEKCQDNLVAERMLKIVINDATGKRLKNKFWESGVIKRYDKHVHIRAVENADRDMFIELRKETSIIKSTIEEEAYQIMLWNEHMQDKSMMFTIVVDGKYAGYCGINNIAYENWEIAIELLKRFHNKGIGYTAISIMLSEIKSRLAVDEFRVKIYPDNYASQQLFEKLGATPYGIAENILHEEEEIRNCEEENLDLIDDQLIHIAKKFAVEPRKLLSHVLEYELKWDE